MYWKNYWCGTVRRHATPNSQELPHRAKNSSHKTCAISRVVYRCTRTRYVDVIESVKVEEDDWQVESGLR